MFNLISKYFKPDYLSTLNKIIAKENNKFISYLSNYVKKHDGINIKDFFMYGVSSVPRPLGEKVNRDLATYFLTLSELKGLSAQLRDFAINMMTFCENDKWDSNFWSDENMKKKTWDPMIQLDEILRNLK